MPELKRTAQIVGEGLVKIASNIPNIRNGRVIDDPTFLGADFEITSDHFGFRLGYLPFSLDKLVVQPDNWEMQDPLSMKVVPRLDKRLRSLFHSVKYSGRKIGKIYRYPFGWELPLASVVYYSLKR